MTMQPLLIAPDGAINKAMIHTGPVLTSFFTPRSFKPRGPSYLTPPFVLIILIIVTASRARASCQMFSYRLRSCSKGQRGAQFPPLLHTGGLMDCGPATTCFIVGFLARRLDLHYFCPLHPLCFSIFFFSPASHLAALSIRLVVR